MKNKTNKWLLFLPIVLFVIWIAYLFLWEDYEKGRIISDELLIYSLSGLTFATALLSFRISNRFGLVNLVVLVVYSARFYYGLFYQSNGGSGLLWLFYIVIVTPIHLLFLLTYLFRDAYK